MRGWRMQRRWNALGRATFLGTCVLVILLPLLWTILASFNVKPNDTVSPPTWSLPPSTANYVEVLVEVPGFPREFWMSVAVSTTATLLTITVAFLAAYGLARSRFRGKNLLVQSFLVLGTLPVIAFVIPLSNVMRQLSLGDTFLGVTLAETAVYTPLAVYILYGYLAQVPPALEDAARLEGASLLQLFREVVVPVAMPGLAATTVIMFVLTWNVFIVPLAVAVQHIRTIPIALIDFFTFERELEWSTAAAALTVSLVPAVALLAFAHRALERFSLGPLWEVRQRASSTKRDSV